MRKYIFFIIIFLISMAMNTAFAATEFVSIIAPNPNDFGVTSDYTTLSSWIAVMQCDLTASHVKVFTHSGITGTVADDSTVISSGGMAATVVHATATQIMVKAMRTPLTGTLTFPKTGTTWAASTAYSLGDVVQPATANGYSYTCTTDGTSGAAAPVWPTSEDATVTDGTVGWTAHYLRTVTGSGTIFLSQIGIGDAIWLDADRIWVTVSSVSSNTSLTISASYTGTGGTGAGYIRTGSLSQGERLSVDGSNYVDLTNAGDSVIAAAECYPIAAGNGAVNITGITTSATNYVHIYAPAAYTHTGKWVALTSCFTIYTTTSDWAMYQNTKNVLIEGIQIYNNKNVNAGGIVYTPSIGAGELIYDRVIFRGKNSVNRCDGFGWGTGGTPNMNGSYIIIKNSVFWNLGNNANTAAIFDVTGSNYRCFNVTIYNSQFGFRGFDTGDKVVNCAIVKCYDGYNGAFSSDSDYNIIADQSLAYGSDGITVPGANSQALTGVVAADIFVGPTSGDLHLKTSDTYALGHGTNLFSVTSKDIDNERPNTWNVGADQTTTQALRVIRAGQAISTIARSSGTTTVTLSAAYPNNNLKVGQMIVISGVPLRTFNGVFTIASVAINQTQFTINQSYLPNASTTGGTAGGDYSTLTAWEAAFGGVNFYLTGATAGDLVTAQRIATAECYNDWASGLDDKCVIDGWTTSASYYSKVYTPTSERHNGTAKDASGNYTGFTIKPTSGSYAACLSAADNYVRIDGIIADMNDLNFFYGFIGTSGGGANYSQITNCIAFNGNRTVNGYPGFSFENSGTIYIANCLAYDCRDGFSARYWTTGYYYNCTAVNNAEYGFRAQVGNCAQTFKNCLSSGNTTADFYKESTGNTFTLSYCASSDGTATTAGDAGTGNRASQTFSFTKTTAGQEDYHLLNTDTGAKGYGTDLSSDANYAFNTDIDGLPRLSGIWDIGMDQIPTPIYRSVGPSNTTALATGTSNALTIDDATGTATFSTDLPPNVGVGDVIQYATNGGNPPDSLAFIHSRTSATQFTVRRADGRLPASANSNQNWNIYRAYTSLANAEKGDENDALNDTLENFDDWVTGGAINDNDVGRDLVAANEQWNIACYADAADTANVTIQGWTTGPKNYMKIYTPVNDNEVGVSQRHIGKWDTNAYYMSANYSSGVIWSRIDYLRIEGLQIDNQDGASADASDIYIYSDSGTIETGDVRVSSCVLKGGKYSIKDACLSTSYLFNNIIYNASTGGIVLSTGGQTAYAYNNTVYNCGTYGYYRYAGTLIVKNNIAQSCTDGFSGPFDAGSDYNLSDLAGDTTGISASYREGEATTVSFVDAANRNLHLATADTMAAGTGTNLSADTYLSFNNDIDSGLRWAPWCIGADQSALGVASGVSSGLWSATGVGGTWASQTMPTATQDVIIASGKTVTFDKNDSATSPTCGTITVAGTLVIDTATNQNRTMVVNGDIIVASGGVLRLRANSNPSYSTTIKFNCNTNAQYGLIVESGGTLDIQGTSKYDPDVVITALTQDGSHNAYIYCQDVSKSKFKFADISYMGANNGGPSTYGWGIYIASIDSSSASEYFYLEGTNVHHCYLGLDMANVNNSVIFDNSFYSITSSYAAIGPWSQSGQNQGNIIAYNKIYNNSGKGIELYGGSYNVVIGNISRANSNRGLSLTNSTSNNYIYNNVIDANSANNGIIIDSGCSNNAIKNNIITNNATGLTDNGTSTTIDRNLFYGNTSDGATGTNAITEQNPNFVSTDTSSVNFMNVAVGSAALGAGYHLDGSTNQNTTNIGARLGYVYNATQAKKFNSLQLCDDDATYYPVAGNTITAYAVDLKASTISSRDATGLPPFYLKITCATDIISVDGNYIGQYMYMSSGANKGKYYLIVGSVAATDVITILVSAAVDDFTYTSTTGFNAEDGFTIVDRIYNDLAGDCYVLKFNKPGTAASPITWNTSGTVIVDARNVVDKGPNGTGGTTNTNGYTIATDASANSSYNIFDGFIIRGGATAGFGNNSSGTSTGIILKNSKLCYNNGDGAKYRPDVLDNCEIFNNYSAATSMTGLVTSCVAYNSASYGLYGGLNCVMANNRAFANATNGGSVGGIDVAGSSDIYSTIIGNTAFCNSYFGIANTWSSNYVKFINNTSVANLRNGIYSVGANIVARNNLLANNGSGGTGSGYYGLYIPAGNVSDFNYFYGNGSNNICQFYGVTEGSNSIPSTNVAGTDPSFSQLDTGTSDANSTTTMIIDAGQNWTVNQWVGYGVKVGSSWSGITSNTANRLYISPALSGAPSVGTTFYITDFSLPGKLPASQITPLGQGCKANGTKPAGTSVDPLCVNMGAIRDFVKNTNAAGAADDKVYNSMQNAHDDNDATYGCSAGDTISTYAIDEVTIGTISAVANNGATTTLSITEDIISAADQYIGYYLYIYAGANRGKYYLIADSATASPDTITIYSSYATGFNAGDKFKIIDRVYTRDGGVGQSSNLYSTKDGTATQPITWNTSGTVVIDKSNNTYGILGSNSDYIKLEGFKVFESGATINRIGFQVGGGSEYCVVKNNEFYNCSAPGDTDYTKFEKNYFWLKAYTSGTYISTSPMGAGIGNGHSHDNYYYDNIALVRTSTVNDGYGCVQAQGSRNVVVDNKLFGSYVGIPGGGANNIMRGNIVVESFWHNIDVPSGAGTNTKIINNTLVHQRNSQSGAAIAIDAASDSATISLRNNIIHSAKVYGIRLGSAVDDFNYFYNSGTADVYTGSIGANSITGTAPGFYAEDTGTADTGSTTAVLIDAGQGWTANEWVGAVVHITGGTGSGQWAGIASNTAERLFVAPEFTIAPDNTSTFEITKCYIAGTTETANTPLGQGCRADGSNASNYVNMGARLGYVVNDDQTSNDRKFNYPQAANDDANLDSGDIVTIYAVNETSGTISAAVTDNGATITVPVSDIISADYQYVGMYLYDSTLNKYYLIVGSSTGATDTVTLLAEDNPGFNIGDIVTIVDRVYNEKSHASANFSLTKSGVLSQWITWADSGTILLDAESLRAYNVYADTGLNFVRLKDTIKFLNYTNTTPPSPLFLGGVAITNQANNYYMWGDADRPTLLNSSSGYDHSLQLLTLRFSEEINVSQVTSAQIKLSPDISGTPSITLSDPEKTAGQTLNSDTYTFTLTDANRNTVASWVADGKTTLYASLGLDAVKDPTGNGILATGWLELGTWNKDTTAPTLSSWFLDMTMHRLTMVFNEDVDVSTLDATKITLQSAETPGSSHSLSVNCTTGSVDGTTIVIDIITDDYNTIADTSPALAVSEATSWLVTAAGAIKNMSGISLAAISATQVPSGNYTADNATPSKFTVKTTGGLTSASMTAGGTAIPVIITAYDTNWYRALSYAGSKTIVFSGAGTSVDGNKPKANNTVDGFTAEVGVPITFVNGISTGTNNVQLFKRETAAVKAADTANSVSTPDGSTLNITVNPAVKNKLAFIVQPSGSGTINVALAQQPQVEIRDTYGNRTDDTDSTKLWASITQGIFSPATGTLANDTVNAVLGAAVFTGLAYNQIGTIYLQAKATGLNSTWSESSVTFSAAGTTTVDKVSLATDGVAPIANSNIVPTNDTADEKFDVLRFKITDAGLDATNTFIDQIKIAIGGTGLHASTDIAWAGLYKDNGAILVQAASSITDDYIIFGSEPDNSSSASLDTVTENSSTIYDVYIYMKPNPDLTDAGRLDATDGKTYTFSVNEGLIGVDTGTSSQMHTPARSDVTTVVWTIKVDVAYLEVLTAAGASTATVTAGTAIELKIVAVDANRNIDIHYGLAPDGENKTLKFAGLGPMAGNEPRIESSVFGYDFSESTNITIPFLNGVSGANNVTLTAYKRETGTLEAREYDGLGNSKYLSYPLPVTVESLKATTVTATAGNSQVGKVSKALPTLLLVTTGDAYGNTVSDVDITFAITAPADGATLSVTSGQKTNSSGQLSTQLTLGSVSKTYTVTATATGPADKVQGTPSATFTAIGRIPTAINRTGDGQTQNISTQLATPFTARLVDAANNPVPNELITLSIPAGGVPAGATGYSMTTPTGTPAGTTNANGQTSTTLTLGNKVGNYIVRAEYSGVPSVDFTATATTTGPSKVALTAPASITAAKAPAEPTTVFTVTITDDADNVTNITSNDGVTFNLITGSTGAFYSDISCAVDKVITTLTIAKGSSTAQFYYKQDEAVNNIDITVARASGQTLSTKSTDTKSVNIVPADLYEFRLTGSSTLTAGVATSLTIRAYDAHNNLRTNFTGSLDLRFKFIDDLTHSSPSGHQPTCGGGNIGNNSTDGDVVSVSFTAGVATPQLILYKPETALVIKAYADSGQTTSDTYDLHITSVKHNSANHTKFSGNLPTPQDVGVEFSFDPVTLNVVDAYDNICNGANGGTAYNSNPSVNNVTWTMTGIANSPDGSQTDSYVKKISFTNGQSTTALSATLYRSQATKLSAAVTGLTGTNVVSNEITLNAGAVNKLWFSQDPAESGITAQSLSRDPKVSVADQYGNATNAPGSITLAAYLSNTGADPAGHGTLTSDQVSNTTPLVGGIATFTHVKYSYPEIIYLKATVVGQSLAAVYSIPVSLSAANDLTTSAVTTSATISSIKNLTADKVSVFAFKVTDAGTDGLDGKITQIVINRDFGAGGGDTAGDWTEYINAAWITDGTSERGGIVAANSITFTPVYTIANATNKTYTLKITLKTSLPEGADGKKLGFQIDANSDISVDPISSKFAAVDAITGTATVGVVVTNLVITGSATMEAGTENIITLTAQDANGNVDLDYSNVVTGKAITFSPGGAGVSPEGNKPPTCRNYSLNDIDFGEATDILFTAGVGTTTMILYKAETATISATDGTISTQSGSELSVVVSPTGISKLSWSTQPAAKVVSNAPWKSFVVKVADQYGNTITSSSEQNNVTISLSPITGDVAIAAGAEKTVGVSAGMGLATFSNFYVTGTGAVKLVASATYDGTDYTSVPSNAVTVEGQYNITVNVTDSLTGQPLTEDVSLKITGTAIDTTGSSPFSITLPYGTYNLNLSKPKYVDLGIQQVASVAVDGADGSYDNNITWNIVMTSLEEATADYQVKSSFVYDEESESLTVRLWLERRGKLILNDAAARNILGTAKVNIYFETGGDPLVTINFDAPDKTNTTLGVYKKMVENVLLSGGGFGATPLVAGRTYYANCQINYGGTTGNPPPPSTNTGRTYESGTTFTVTIAQKLSREIIGKLGVPEGETLTTKIASAVATEALTTRAAVSSAQSTLTGAVSSAQTTLSGAITSTQNTLTTAVSTAQTAITDIVKSEILNSESSMRAGQTLTIRYRTYTGLSPKIDVYDGNNNLRINKGSMKEIGRTGIYEYDVKFLTGWGYGDYTVVCSESTKGSMDAYTLSILRSDIEQVYSQVSAVMGNTSGIGDVKTVANTLNSQVGVLETALSKISKDMVSDVKDAVASATALESVYTQLNNVAKQIKDMTGPTGINLEKLYSVSAEKKQDIMYLKNKTQELKAAMDVSQKLVENIANRPVTQTWYEYR